MGHIKTLDELRSLYGAVGERSALKMLDRLDPHCRRFIELSPFALLASYGANGLCDVTPRGDQPGFVHIVDDKTLVLPDRPGNNRLDSLLNIIANPGIGLLFLIPGVDESLRVNGRAEVRDDAELLAPHAVNGRLPKTVLKIIVDEAYLHCAKALMRSALWDPSARIERSVLPSMGQMMKDQIGWATAETQTEMVDRYRQTLY